MTTIIHQLNSLWQQVAEARKEAARQSLYGHPRLANVSRRRSLWAQREIRRLCMDALKVQPSIN